MASGNDMKMANETYGGFIGLVKYGSVVVAVVAAGVIALIA
ncbi:aa3-type cytochrome c oxidase subunit IV [Novosphingobium ginsenosidimutans]|uniref:Aa3-type cytochrome c oxidase subunit IV n=1 Tax=Novosphingobium ginsenosidimutans TaxID=1176536 RepID=A0A5B8SAU0_9SPHN|nr:aa3-type cytochrome c oxidase subunit IV [Novosphingobium ginsenosidimutans]QEA17285.1 aa3-type cytochrome c oxidase subunit IV [Novosphingobium ginsenosidimutans]